VEEGGNNDFVHKLPGRCKVSNLTLKRGVGDGEFLKWVYDVGQANIKPQQVSVVMYNINGSVAMRWNLRNAFPVKWTGPTFKADDNGTAIESIEIAHSGLDFEPKPPQKEEKGSAAGAG
jgi:phage tail-like protein